MGAPKKSNGNMLKIAIPIVVVLLGLGSFNTQANSSLKDRVHENEAARREIDAEIKGDLKALKEGHMRVEKKIDRLLEK